MQIDDAEARLKNLTWLVTGSAAFMLAFVVSMTALMLWQAYRLGGTASEVRTIAVQTHDSICALRADIQHRHDTTVKYLADHQDPYILGVPRETFEKGVRDQEATLEALNSLDC